MSPLYSIVNALTQTAATITLILSFLNLFLNLSSFVWSNNLLFLSLQFSPERSFIFPFLLICIFCCCRLKQNNCAHTPRHARHQQSLTRVKLWHFETPTLSLPLYQSYNANHSSHCQWFATNGSYYFSIQRYNIDPIDSLATIVQVSE